MPARFQPTWHSKTGDAVPGPLAFFAFRQQHDKGARRRHEADRTARIRQLPGVWGGDSGICDISGVRLMLLAQGEKCRGLGQSPKRPGEYVRY